MFSSYKHCLNRLRKWVKISLHQLEALKKVMGGKKRKPKNLSSSFNWITSSFATMEVSNQLRQVFQLIDVNGDGKISSLELGEVLLCLGHEKSTATREAEGMVREVDCNGDGYIDLEEFISIVGGGNGESGSSSKEDDLMDAFLIFDSDKNGFISANELQNVLVSLGCKCSMEECLQMIRGVDKNGDELVDFEEFKTMMVGCTG